MSTSTTSTISLLDDQLLRNGPVQQDITTIYVMVACATFMVYAFVKVAGLKMLRSRENPFHHLKVDLDMRSQQDKYYNVLVELIETTSFWASVTAATKIMSISSLIYFELQHIFSMNDVLMPSENYQYFYRRCIGPIILLPIVISDLMTMTMTLNVGTITTQFTLLRKRECGDDSYANYAIEQTAGTAGTAGTDEVTSEFSDRSCLFTDTNDPLGIISNIERWLRYIMYLGARAFIVVEIVMSLGVCFGLMTWMMLVNFTLSQIVLLGIICAILKMLSWGALMASMGFEIYRVHPFNVVQDHLGLTLNGGIGYVCFRVIAYLGSVQMFRSYAHRLEVMDTFQRVDGDSIIFFLVLDTASMATATLWISSNCKFVQSMRMSRQSFFETCDGISLVEHNPAWTSTGSLESGDLNSANHPNVFADHDGREFDVLRSEHRHILGEADKVVAFDSRAVRLCSVESGSYKKGNYKKHLIRRFILNPSEPTLDLLSDTFNNLTTYYNSFPSFIRGLFVPVVEVVRGHTIDEVWVIYQWPGEDWNPPAYWLCDSEYSDDPVVIESIMFAILHAVADLNSNGINHGYIDPNVSVLLRAMRDDLGVSFDVLFLDWGFDMMKGLRVTSFATQCEMRAYAETAPWMADEVWCSTVKHSAPTSFNSGLRWVAPEFLLQETTLKKGFTLLAYPEATRHHQIASKKSSRDSYFLGLLLWITAMRLTKLSPVPLSPYGGLSTDEEVILKVSSGARPNISQLRGMPGYWGSDLLQDVIKGCMSRNPDKRPSATSIRRRVSMDRESGITHAAHHPDLEKSTDTALVDYGRIDAILT